MIEYYAAIERNIVLLHATRVNFENVQSERSQTHKTTYYTISFIRNDQNSQIQKESVVVIAYDWGERKDRW